MRRLWLPSFLLLVLTSALTAQEPRITRDTPVDYSVLHSWLHSDDPRLIAWAADFAGTTHDTKIIAEMPALLEHGMVPSLYGDKTQTEKRMAVFAILDTLIQENAKVPISTIKVITESFPIQATILISRLPLSESAQTLSTWTLGATGTWNGRTLARVASMMIAKDPKSVSGIWVGNFGGFVASVVAASEQELHIIVSSTSMGSGSGIGNACGDFMGGPPTPGWPQIYTYDLVENDSQVNTPVVVELDGDRIVSRRFELNHPWGSCNAVQPLDARTRHRLIAYWLGTPEKQMSWQPVQTFSIVWSNKAAYQRQVGEIIESQRDKLHATVKELQARGLLTEDEASIVSPKIIVTIKCEIKPCPLM
jgi:hypothetical protein